MHCCRNPFLLLGATAVVAVVMILSFERRLPAEQLAEPGSSGPTSGRRYPQWYEMRVLNGRIDPAVTAESIQSYNEMKRSVDRNEDIQHKRKKKVLLYTKDSRKGYTKKNLQLPAGEIRMRWSLTMALHSLDVFVDTATTEEEFTWLAEQHTKYSAFVLDVWTLIGKDRQSRSFLAGRERHVYILDYFGRQSFPKLNLDLKRNILTAFPAPAKNAFLGYSIGAPPPQKEKMMQGIFWGQLNKYSPKFRMEVLHGIADVVKVVTHLRKSGLNNSHPNIEYIGYQTPEAFDELLANSRFLLSFGDTLNDATAMDAVMNGCMYIDTVYETPRTIHGDAATGDLGVVFESGHPYVAERLGHPRVCTAREGVVEDYVKCAREAVRMEPLQPFVPQEFKGEAYRQRVRTIFHDVLDGEVETKL